MYVAGKLDFFLWGEVSLIGGRKLYLWQPVTIQFWHYLSSFLCYVWFICYVHISSCIFLRPVLHNCVMRISPCAVRCVSYTKKWTPWRESWEANTPISWSRAFLHCLEPYGAFPCWIKYFVYMVCNIWW
jgi:hypothetical protein